MSIFSDRIKSAIEDSGLSIAALSAASGISVSMIYKIQTGSRLPDSTETLERLLFALACPLPIQQDLIQTYRIERVGHTRYACFRTLLGMLQDMVDLPEPPAPLSTVALQIPSAIPGILQVSGAVHSLLEQEIARENGEVLMSVPGHSGILTDLLPHLLHKAGPGFRGVHHLFCLSASMRDKALHENMKTLRTVLPKMLAMEKYDPWYSYLSDPDNGTVPFPYYIITDAGVLLIAGDFHSAVFLRDPEIRNQYRRLFYRIQSRFYPIVNEGVSSMRGYQGIYHRLFQEAKPDGLVAVLQASPFLLPCLSPDAFHVFEQLSPDPDGLRAMRERCKAMKYTTFFTIGGLHELFRTGMLPELQGQQIPSLSRKDVLDSMKELVRRARAGQITPCIFQRDVFHGHFKLSLGLFDRKLLTVCDMPQRHTAFADVTSATLGHVLRDYVSCAQTLGDVFSPEESIDMIERRLRDESRAG